MLCSGNMTSVHRRVELVRSDPYTRLIPFVIFWFMASSRLHPDAMQSRIRYKICEESKFCYLLKVRSKNTDVIIELRFVQDPLDLNEVLKGLLLLSHVQRTPDRGD